MVKVLKTAGQLGDLCVNVRMVGGGGCDNKIELEQIVHDFVGWIPTEQNEIRVLVYCEHCRRIHVSRNPRDFSKHSGFR